jgi:hypothetical protein
LDLALKLGAAELMKVRQHRRPATVLSAMSLSTLAHHQAAALMAESHNRFMDLSVATSGTWLLAFA